MSYIAKFKKQKLTRQIPVTKKTGDLGLSSVKTNEAFYVPTWAWFDGQSTIYNRIQEAQIEGAPVYDTIWIGKNIVPTIYYVAGVWRDYPSKTKTVLKSLAFEDGREDNFIETMFNPDIFPNEGPHTIAVTHSIRFPKEITPALMSVIELSALDEENNGNPFIKSYDISGPLNAPDKYSWNIYLPNTLSTIDFTVLSNFKGYYNEELGNEGVDQQVHIYLNDFTEVPTIVPGVIPQLDAPAIPDTYTNLYFHVPADLYDAFVEAYNGQFKGIIKIKDLAVEPWVKDNSLDEFKKEYFEPSYTPKYKETRQLKLDTIDFTVIDPTRSTITDISTKIVVDYLSSEAVEINEAGEDPDGVVIERPDVLDP